MYCLYIPVLHVYVWMVCIVCIVCICMYLHVLYVLEILYVCVCIVCICLYISKRFFRYIHIHAHTYIHTIHTKYRYVANVCMCMYFRVNTYIIQTAGFTYRQIQTCRFPDEFHLQFFPHIVLVEALEGVVCAQHRLAMDIPSLK